MAGINNYHNEALRKTRILQRQKEAAQRQSDIFGSSVKNKLNLTQLKYI